MSIQIITSTTIAHAALVYRENVNINKKNIKDTQTKQVLAHIKIRYTQL